MAINNKIMDFNQKGLEIVISTHGVLTEITKPLFSHTKFGKFVYGQFFLDEHHKNEKVSYFCTDFPTAQWLMLEVEENGSAYQEAMRTAPQDEYSYFIFPQNPDDYPFKIHRERFGFCNGITMYKRYLNRIDAWEFSMSTNNACRYSLTGSLAQELKNWSDYFNFFLPQLKSIGEPVKYFSEVSDLSYKPIVF